MQDIAMQPIDHTAGQMLTAYEKFGIMGVFIVMFVMFVSIMAWLVVSGNKRYERAISANALSKEDAEENKRTLQEITAQNRVLCQKHESMNAQTLEAIKSLAYILEKYIDASQSTLCERMDDLKSELFRLSQQHQDPQSPFATGWIRTEIAAIIAKSDLTNERVNEIRTAQREDAKSVSEQITSIHDRLTRHLEQTASNKTKYITVRDTPKDAT